MTVPGERLRRWAGTFAQLSGEGLSSESAARLEELLVQTSVADIAAGRSGTELSVEGATWPDLPAGDPEVLARLNRQAVEGDGEGPARYRVFRREVGVVVPDSTLSTPAWGRGASISDSLGPFVDPAGRKVWFDFYPRVKLVPVYLEGDPQPAVLFHVHQLKLQPIDTFSPPDFLRLLKSKKYKLASGSIWVRANLLAPTAPPGKYVGLSVEGGSLTFTPLPDQAGDKLIIPAGGQVYARLRLRAPAAAAGPGEAGIDAAEAVVNLPRSFAFTLSGERTRTTELGDASWVLYGDEIGFSLAGDAPASYHRDIRAVMIPMEVSKDHVEVQNVGSPFAQPGGVAGIRRSGWTLPVAEIDTADPPVAEGAGALAVQTRAGLTFGWRGLEGGLVRLRRPWLMLAPGLVFWSDRRASNIYAHQTLRLWKDEDSRFRSELELRYTDSFRLRYASAAAGTEWLLTEVNVDARIDRPVDVGGTPLSVHTLDSQLSLTYTDDGQAVALYDDNILVDSKDPAATWPEEPGAVSIAIRNALLAATPVNSLLLFAELADERTVASGQLLVGMGLYGLLPTLPDPYAANVGPLRRAVRDRRSVQLLLFAATSWDKAALDEDPDTVAVRFAFAPITELQLGDVAPRITVSQADTEPGGDDDAVMFAQSSNSSSRWDGVFGDFEREQFALLDVSSNADQMGVSFAWFDPTSAEPDSPFHRVFGVQSADEHPSPEFPLAIHDLDLSAQSRFVRAFTVPQVSWEPLINLPGPQPPIPGDPPLGANLYPNDGGPTRLFNNSVRLVPIAPLPVTEHLVEDFAEEQYGFTGSLFTLPFGLRAFAEFSRVNPFKKSLGGARLNFNRPEYPDDGLVGGLQLQADAPRHPAESPIFQGSTVQLDNVVDGGGSPTGAGTLGKSVGFVFNQEFFDGSGYKDRGVPLTRIDFSGYGASIFSHWMNPNAAIAATSQAFFDVFVGRTAHEVVQIRSLLYPWGVRVVRTITIFRTSSAHVYRFDTGWQAESEGRYDFSFFAYNDQFEPILQANPYQFHPGIVRGVTQVRNIVETTSVPRFETTWDKSNGDRYVDDNGRLGIVEPSTPTSERSPEVSLQPVFFDADVIIDGVESGGTDGRVPSRAMLGYVQLAPRGEPLSPNLFAQLLETQFGSVGGPLDCVVDVAGSGQRMRLARVDVNSSADLGGDPIFVSAGRGSVVLPKDGSWSVVVHLEGSGEVAPLDTRGSVPVVRRGILDSKTQTTDAGPSDLLRIADPAELVTPPNLGTRNYGFLQSTGTQKALFRLPSFQQGVAELLGAPPDFADAYRVVNSTAIFPNVGKALPLALGAFKTKIIEEGYRLLDEADPDKVFEQILPPGPLFLINEDFLKLYVEYANNDKDGNKVADGNLRFGLDSAAADVSKRWLSKVEDIAMVVDLGPLKRVMMIKGKFDAEKGKEPAFIEPELAFSDALQPVIDILQILQQLQGGDYKAAFSKGLEIAMSNSADSWSYAFHARKEIPVVQFPPGPLYDLPTNPLKLEAHMAVGVYFNEVVTATSDPKQLLPSAGAFLEFGGRLSVMCLSVAAATIYATGSVDLRTSADTKTGPALDMKFGFGAEVVVGLPVVGNVSLLYMVGVEIHLDKTAITVAGFLLFRGRAEILEGLVTVTITIEAKGSVKRIAASDRTDMIAQVTFGLDISIFLVINISFSESWQESRQIA